MCKIKEPREGQGVGIPPPEYSGQAHTFLILGGDTRQLSLAVSLEAAGGGVRCMGLGGGDETPDLHPGRGSDPLNIRIYSHLGYALEDCDGIVLPYPVTKDGQTLYCPLEPRLKLHLSLLMAHHRKHPTVTFFGGRFPTEWRDAAKTHGLRLVDYEDSELLLSQNALLTAEGALMTAMQLTDTAVADSPMAVLGYGRIGRYLSRLLVALGAEVTVFARRQESRAQAEAAGCRSAAMEALALLKKGYRVIFNTIPTPVLDKELLTALPCDTLLLELASAPGGLDPEGEREAVRRCGLQILHVPALPGRYAPRTAGDILGAYVLRIMAEGEVLS